MVGNSLIWYGYSYTPYSAQFQVQLRYSWGAVMTSVAFPSNTIKSFLIAKTDCGWGEHNTYVYDALILKICFRVYANVVRAPATCRHGHTSRFEWIYTYIVRNGIEYTILFSRFCLSPAPREEKEVSNVLSSLRFHLHKGLLFVHMQI